MITEFQGEFRWLSNFWPVDIKFEGIIYPSVEHAYMSAKSNRKEWKELCANTIKPGDVKRKSRSIGLVKNWDKKRLVVMEECLRQKFNQEPYKTRLINTGEDIIQEGNRWGDKFWGVCLKTNEGQNNLGKLIMKIRSELER